MTRIHTTNWMAFDTKEEEWQKVGDHWPPFVWACAEVVRSVARMQGIHDSNSIEAERTFHAGRVRLTISRDDFPGSTESSAYWLLQWGRTALKMKDVGYRDLRKTPIFWAVEWEPATEGGA